MEQRKSKVIGMTLFLSFIVSLFFDSTELWFKCLQGLNVCLIVAFEFFTGKLYGKGTVKTDFPKGVTYTFLGLVSESNDWDALHEFFLEKDGKRIYSKGYFYPRFPKKGDSVVVGKNPHGHANDVVSFTPAYPED